MCISIGRKKKLTINKILSEVTENKECKTIKSDWRRMGDKIYVSEAFDQTQTGDYDMIS